MLTAERREIILSKLRQDGRVLVSPLAQQFEVSEETIRRDLFALEEQGFATKCYGGATLTENRDAPPFRIRKKLNVEEKRAAATAVASLINDGDYLMLDDSSTCYFVVRALQEKRHLTIITNSIEIMLELNGKHDDWNVFSTGGRLDQNVFALFGRQTEATLNNFHVNKAIISCTGIDSTGHFTEAGVENTSVKKAMIANAKETILVMDHHKIDKTGLITVGDLSQISTLVVDKPLDAKWKSFLSENKVRLVTP